MSSTDQLMSLPDSSGLDMIFLRFESERTRMGCARKYGRSFLAAMTRARASFSVSVYLTSTGVKALET